MSPLNGIHHVTAIAGDAQSNVDFYSGALGLRLVKKTVNFDDPGSYHLYYGDRVGTPGTILTFFVWPGATPKRNGAGEPVAMAFRIPADSSAYWKQRLDRAGISILSQTNRWEETVLTLVDPDGLTVELVESRPDASVPDIKFWEGSPIPEAYAIQGFHSVTLAHAKPENAAKTFTEGLGFGTPSAAEGRLRFSTGASAIDVVSSEKAAFGRMGAGTIHHLAFRTESDKTQLDWQQKVLQLGLQVSPVMNRNYFHSIYFREPGGVLFEVATDGPGFSVDEPEAVLGESLKLPEWYESMRTQLEKRLPQFVVRQVA